LGFEDGFGDSVVILGTACSKSPGVM
jgi:hypothetical protein